MPRTENASGSELPSAGRLLRALSGVCLLGLALATGCSDTGELAPIEPTLDELDPIVVCDDVTFGELKYQDAISDECRQKVEHLLPDPSSTFTRLYTLGSRYTEDGSLEFHVYGAREDGVALTVDDFAELGVSAGPAGAPAQPLPPGVIQISQFAGTFAVAFVNDHSATLRDADLEAIAELETRLFEALPSGSQAALWRFSDNVEAALPFTSDGDELSVALAASDTPPRETTALYDGLGAAVEALLSRHEAVRFLVLTTDGLDNASQDYRRAELALALRDNGISGLLLASLFADAPALRSLFARSPVSFQAPSMTDLPAQLSEYLAALGSVVTLTVPPEYAGHPQYRAELGGRSVALR